MILAPHPDSSIAAHREHSLCTDTNSINNVQPQCVERGVRVLMESKAPRHLCCEEGLEAQQQHDRQFQTNVNLQKHKSNQSQSTQDRTKEPPNTKSIKSTTAYLFGSQLASWNELLVNVDLAPPEGVGLLPTAFKGLGCREQRGAGAFLRNTSTHTTAFHASGATESHDLSALQQHTAQCQYQQHQQQHHLRQGNAMHKPHFRHCAVLGGSPGS